MNKLFFDIESTGPDVNKDRIVELAIRVVDEEGNVIVDKAKRYNPGIPISKNASDIHGIKDSDVRDLPSFKEDAKKLKKLFEDKIIVTYNGLRFDIPMLQAEFERAGVELTLSGQYIDVLKVERKLNSNSLSSVYKKYTGQDLEGAHGAMADVNATQIVMENQIKLNSLSEDDLFQMTDTKGMADLSGKLIFDDKGFLVFNFGNKCKGKRVIDEPSYASWVLGESTFSSQIKKLIRDEQTKGLKGPRIAPKEKIEAKAVPVQGFHNLPKNGVKTSYGFKANVTSGFKPIQTDLDLNDDDLPF